MNALAISAPAIHGAGSTWSSNNPSAPPNAAPPRLPAWNHALTRPCSASLVVTAMIASMAMPTIELIRLAAAMITSSSGSVCSLIGRADIPKTPRAEAAVAKTYHFFGERVTSTIGAHVHLSQLVSRFAPLRSEVSVTESPFALAMKVSATPTKPESAPNGM